MKLFAGWILALIAWACFGGVSQAQSGPAQKSSGAAEIGRYANVDSLKSLPDWSGIWTFDFPMPGTGLSAPELTPASAVELKKLLDLEAHNDEPATEAANCLPPGMPTIMFMPYDVEFLFTPGRVTIVQEAYMQVRRVFTDGRPHPSDPDPTFNGHSIGHWEGDTLVVDTVGMRGDTWLTRPGTPHSDQLHIVERDGDSTRRQIIAKLSTSRPLARP